MQLTQPAQHTAVKPRGSRSVSPIAYGASNGRTNRRIQILSLSGAWK